MRRLPRGLPMQLATVVVLSNQVARVTLSPDFPDVRIKGPVTLLVDSDCCVSLLLPGMRPGHLKAAAPREYHSHELLNPRA